MNIIFKKRFAYQSLFSKIHFVFLMLPLSVSFANQETASSLFYDPVSGKYVTQEQLTQSTDRELIFSVRLDDGLILGDLEALDKQNQIWVDIEQVIALLDFPIEINAVITESKLQTLEADGWFISPDKLFSIESVSPGEYQVVSDAFNDQFSENDWLIEQQKLYFPLSQVFAWFQIESDADSRQLTLTLTPKQRLPIQNRLRRANRQGSTSVVNLEPKLPRADEPYRLFGPVFTDIQLSGNHDRDDNYQTKLSVLGAGDLAYMTGRYFLGTQYNSFDSNNGDIDFRLTLERNSLEPDLLGVFKATQVEFGDIIPTTINNLSGVNEVGARISNQPFGRITNSQTTNIIGYQQPGWEVELYRNGIFLGSTQVKDNGQYEFLDQQLFVGKNEFRLVFYGPQGQREEKTELFNLDAAALVGGKLIYDVSISQQNKTFQDVLFEDENSYDANHARFNSHFEKGIGAAASVTFDIASYVFEEDQKRHDFVQPGIRLFWQNTLINAQVLKDLSQGQLSSLNLSRPLYAGSAHNLTYAFRSASKDFQRTFNETYRLKQSHQLSLNGPIFGNARYAFSYQRQTSHFEQTIDQLQLGLGGKLGRVSLVNNLKYNRQKNRLEESLSEQVSGFFQASTTIEQIFMRMGLDYQLDPEAEIDYGYLAFQKYLSDGLTVDLNLTRDFNEQFNTAKLAFSWLNKHAISSLSLGLDEEGYQRVDFSLRFGLGHDPISNSLFTTSERMSTKGAASAIVFEDKNNNQKLDQGETLIENAVLSSPQTRRKDVTNDQGQAFIHGLSSNVVTDIEVEKESLEDPFWIPSNKGISFLPRPGLVKTLLIPVVTAGEIEGTVTVAKKLFENAAELSQVPLTLTNLKTTEKLTTKSSFDGFFLFSMVPPGDYHLAVEGDFLKKNNLKTRSAIPVSIGSDGTLLLGANFELFPADKYAYTDDSKSLEHSYAIDLGTFISEKNAKLVLNLLRGFFPELLSKHFNQTPYEVLLTQSAESQYQLVLGPFLDLNQPKYLCGALNRENLHCKIQKNAIQQIELESLEVSNTIDMTEEIVEINLNEAPQQKSHLDGLIDEARAHPNLETASNDQFTIQLVSLSDQSSALQFIDKFELSKASIEEKVVGQQKRFAVVYGLYPDREAAKDVALDLEKVTGSKAWVRPKKL
ncbi:SPOR domain-containing protein [Thiomicrorhabdus indica]|uniref:SPOR domain-containing protein n=1 Tax=Thiomicrorhabdus indica TaxID=2267253 RepID=UPI00102D7DEB|nr:SPOR domain-containing protein [Thiomicrorhabdus indica]